MCNAEEVLSSQAKTEFQDAIEACLKISPKNGDCFESPHGPIAEWDVSRMTDLSWTFTGQVLFNGDVSKWDVSRVTTLSNMFMTAKSFNSDLSE